MAKHEIKLEESFLEAARGQEIPLRLSLSNRERLAGVISQVSRYDISLNSSGQIITLPKKEIFHINPSRPALDESLFTEVPEEVEPLSRSRVQDEFLNRYIREKTLALFHITNGDELRGVIEGYDGFTIFLRTSRGQTLIYKHGVCSIGPGYRRHTGKDDAK